MHTESFMAAPSRWQGHGGAGEHADGEVPGTPPPGVPGTPPPRADESTRFVRRRMESCFPLAPEIGLFIKTKDTENTKVRCISYTAPPIPGGEKLQSFPPGSLLGPIREVKVCDRFVTVRIRNAWINIWTSRPKPLHFAMVIPKATSDAWADDGAVKLVEPSSGIQYGFYKLQLLPESRDTEMDTPSSTATSSSRLTIHTLLQSPIESAIKSLERIEEPVVPGDRRPYHEVVAERLDTVIYKLKKTRLRVLHGAFQGQEGQTPE